MLSSISSTAAGTESWSLAQARSRAVDDMFKATDTNADGKVTKDELEAALETDSDTSSTSSSKSSVEELFKSLDTAGKGYITKEDVSAAMEKAPPPPSQGARPAGGGGGGGAKAASSSEDEDSSTTTYDPKDLNKDGEVSAQEQLAYVLKQYKQAETTQNSDSATYA